jgi:hypothetical protein
MAAISPIIVCPPCTGIAMRETPKKIPDGISIRLRNRQTFSHTKRWRTWLVLADFRAARNEALKSHRQPPSKSDQSPRSSGRVSARPVPTYVR